MGNEASPPIDDDRVQGNITLENIEFMQIWSGEEKYRMSKLVFKTSPNISKDFYYHDLLGIVSKAPLFSKSSIITSCDFTRENGENHIFRGIWEGEMKPKDTIKWSKSLAKEVTVFVRNEEELGSYIKDETKCDKFMAIKNSFISGDKFTECVDGELHLEVTLDKYRRSKSSETQWAIYKLIIPQNTISSAIRNAVLSEKPKIIENFVKKDNAKKQQSPTQKSITYAQDAAKANLVTIESVDINGNQSDEKATETLAQQLSVLQNAKKQSEEHFRKKINSLEKEINKLKNENLDLNEECKQYKTQLNDVQAKYNELCRNNMLNNRNYKSWNSDMVTDWILRLEPQYGAFDKYKDGLKNKLKEEAVNGSHLASLTTTDLDRFGIKSFEHKQIVLQNIQKLMSESTDENTDYSNEGKNSTHFSG